MSKFEFTVTIVSIVIAFALSELMAGWGRILRHRPRPRFDWLFAAWSVGVLIQVVLHWSGLWLYANAAFEHLHQLFVLLAPPLLMVPLAFLLSPDPRTSDVLDLRAYHREISRPVKFLIAASTTLSLLADVVVGGVLLLSVQAASTLGIVGLWVAAAVSTSRKLDLVALSVLWLSNVGFVFGLLEAPGW